MMLMTVLMLMLIIISCVTTDCVNVSVYGSVIVLSFEIDEMVYISMGDEQYGYMEIYKRVSDHE